MKRWIVAVMIALMGAPVAISLAHEGHEHRIMGTVSMRHEFHLEVKTTDGKTTVLTLNDKTKVRRGDAIVMVDSIKPGERVVVTAVETKGKDGKTVMVATEVRLAASAAAGKLDRSRGETVHYWTAPLSRLQR